MTLLYVLAPLVLALVSAPAALVAGMVNPRLAAPVGAVFAAFAAVSVLWGSLVAGGGTVDAAWIPSWDVRFTVALDGLASLYALLATGIGAVVLVYASRYLPLHLHHEGRPDSDLPRFYFFVLLFMGSMVGLAMAQDLILIFLFWDLTAIASYFLIGFDAHKEESRASALMALVVTGVTAILLLVGSLMLYAEHGTFSVPELAGLVEPGPLLTTAGALILVAGLAKSAQVPFHFWLPRAMAAPTPVSAYLHSAAMVAAGVLLIGRVYPLIQISDTLLAALLVVGLLSIAVGGILALTRDVLKQVLAYSTIAQYGFVVALYGLGGPYGAGGAAFYVLAHALAKSALFLTAGTVTEATGSDRLRDLGGLGRKMPLLAFGSAAAAATLTSLPLGIGFFADEFVFAAAIERGIPFAVAFTICAGTTLAYTWRFWSGIFLGESGERSASPVSRLLVYPVAFLGLLCLFGGFFALPFELLSETAGLSSLGAETPLDATYHLELLPEYLMAAGAYLIGVLLVVSRRSWQKGALAFSLAGKVAGPERAYRASVHGLNQLSDLVHRLEIGNLRGRVASVLLPTAVMVGLAVIATPTGTYSVGELRFEELPLILALLVVAAASAVMTFTRLHITLALVLSSAGFALAVAFAFYGAPDVALVATLIEIMIAVLYFSTMRLIPYKALHRQSQLPLTKKPRKVAISLLAGAFAFVVAWGALSEPPAGETVAREYIERTPSVHAGDTVTAILADFRGFDTLGEITVVCIVLLGVVTLIGHKDPETDDEIKRDSRAGRRGSQTERVTRAVAGLLYLPTLVVAVALLVKGYAEVGDGFSAGVVAALGVVLRHLALGSRGHGALPPTKAATGLAFSGLALALAVAVVPVFLGDAPLTHYPAPGADVIYLGTVELITAVLFDIGITLLVLGVMTGIISAFVYATPAEESGPGISEEERREAQHTPEKSEGP
ncbi:hydrogen gas-evolving membrane-bound hydrogenase subunit E [Rubrobacter indicoceani]|uniref:hydrogen gas-evolving membrane-bound hydrogenase subunit E n=1 Tax=Rubrobacter indicoceani TaxID=2051957 RepID=UPI000E5B0F99|nr:hydrogen gas-evolving membrane-bound hydrogenase subunit E [Rubrobacter indicoceani]